jgi:hypothetical protein
MRFGRWWLLLREPKPASARKVSGMPEDMNHGQVPSALPSLEALEEEARLEYLSGKTEPMGFWADAVVGASQSGVGE